MNIMCAFHHIRQTGILFESQEGERILCVPFTINDKGIVLFEGERDRTGVCAFHGTKWCASELKIQKFRNRDGALIGKS